VRAYTIDGEQAKRKQNALAEIGNPKNVEQLIKHKAASSL